MKSSELSFDGFLMDVNPAYRVDIDALDAYLMRNGCTRKLDMPKSGYLVSYTYTGNKRALLNFVFRKSGLVARIYGDHVQSYPEQIEALPDSMHKAIEKAPACKRLTVGPEVCNSRCNMGYDFTARGVRHQKCRFSCFFFPVNDETIPHIRMLVDAEIGARAAVS